MTSATETRVFCRCGNAIALLGSSEHVWVNDRIDWLCGDGKPHAPVSCPPSAVVDMILPWSEVSEGDLILWHGEIRPVERVAPYGRRDEGVWAVGFSDVPGEVCIPVGTYAAVRRYDTEEG